MNSKLNDIWTEYPPKIHISTPLGLRATFRFFLVLNCIFSGSKCEGKNTKKLCDDFLGIHQIGHVEEDNERTTKDCNL